VQRSPPGADNRDYRWSSTPDADRGAVFGISPKKISRQLAPAVKG
jgi:hypothetical protein